PAQRDRRDVLYLPSRDVELRYLAASCAIDHVRVERVRRHVPVLDRADRMPVAVGHTAVIAAARDADPATFLLPGANPVREGRRAAAVSGRRWGLIHPAAPGSPAVQRDDRTLITDERDDARVARADPQVLIVIAPRGAAQRPPAAAAIGGSHGDDARAVHHI